MVGQIRSEPLRPVAAFGIDVNAVAPPVVEDFVRVRGFKNEENKVEMFLNLSHPEQDLSVPDPYYGGEQGFEDVYQMLNKACDDFLNGFVQ